MLNQRSRLLLCGLLVFGTGCASMLDESSKRKTDKKKEGWSWFKKPEYQEPKSLVAIWSEDTLIQPGKPVTRGFGGRLYFYNEKSQAIPVDGELIVYGFDDTATTKLPSASSSDAELEMAGGKKYRFTAEQFTQHFSHSDLGASYSIWIPWDAVGGDQKKIMLMPTFIGKDQRLVRGECVKLSLSGKTPGLATNQRVNNTVQLASATVPTVDAPVLPQLSTISSDSSNEVAPPRVGLEMKTTTIRMTQPVRGGQPEVQSSSSNNAMVSPNTLLAMQSALKQSNAIHQPTSTNATSPLATTNMNTLALPPLGHGIPTTGWIHPAPSQPLANGASSGSLLSQPPVQGSTASP